MAIGREREGVDGEASVTHPTKRGAHVMKADEGQATSLDCSSEMSGVRRLCQPAGQVRLRSPAGAAESNAKDRVHTSTIQALIITT
jgi:hypothetical protein